MDSFTIEIAGLIFEVHPLYISTKDYCRAYLSSEDPEYCVVVSDQDLIHEQKLLDLEAREEGLKLRKFSGPFLERAVIQRRIAEELLKHNTLLLHGSTVGVDGKAYLFTAPCGTGKSTHTKLWCEVFGSRALMVNDDKPFLKITDDGVLVFGSPWSGKHGLDNNVCFSLMGICILSRGSENLIRRSSVSECFDLLRRQVFFPEDQMEREKANSLLLKLAERVPLWQMECTRDPQAAITAYQAMSIN